MPPLFGGRSQRQAQILAAPHNQGKTLAKQQQGGVSGRIPGTSTSALQVAYRTGLIQTYPATAVSPHGGQVAGVGLQVLNNDGNPVVVMGNLKATGGTDHADFEDGGFAFLDAAGDQVAGYSQPTGLWGFGGGAGGGVSVHVFPFAFDTPNLATGATVAFTDGYTPAINDLLIDFWFQIDTPWDGTTPKGDFGASGSVGSGLLNDWASGAADMTLGDEYNRGSTGLELTDFTDNSFSSSCALGTSIRWQGRFVENTTWVVVVSQNGHYSGGDPGSTQGAAFLYLMTANGVGQGR